MTIQEILKELEVHTGKFPRQALREAMNDPGQMVPELLRILKEAGEDTQSLLEKPEYMAHIYAMYLLAQFRESEAYSLLIDFFSTAGNVSVEVTGDIVVGLLQGPTKTTSSPGRRPPARADHPG
jgi:hypothetical protein